MTPSRRLARATAIVVTLLCLASAVPGPTGAAGSDAVLEAVTPRLLRSHLGFIADDELRGRRTPSRGLRIAARYIAAQLERIGARPAGDPGNYLQRVEMEPDDEDEGRPDAEPRWTENVVAVVEGSDPALRHEYVALGAHYDHVGVGRADEGGDAIYNGADDDGSGTAALLALAEAVAAGPRPPRSLLFVWHAGEESGMWGSRHFVANPTVPLDDVVAQINVDMIGRSRRPGDDDPDNRPLTGPDEVYVIGPRIMSADLDTLIEEVNARYLNLELDREYDDRAHPDRFFFRSDHHQYARAGIPVAFFFTGTHEDYHRPSDHVEEIDFDKLTRVTRTIGAVVLAIAERPQRIRLDPGLE